MDLMKPPEYKKNKKERGLSLRSVEVRLLNISSNELTEDLLIAAVMRDNTSQERDESTGRKVLAGKKSKRVPSTLFYDDHSDSGGKSRGLKLSDDHIDAKTHCLKGDQPTISYNSKKKKKSENNSIGHTGSSSNRIFDKRRSSSKSDVETARFNKVEGLASSRNYDNGLPPSSKRSRAAKTLDLRPAEDPKPRDLEPYLAGPLLNTFSTIKPTEPYDYPNNSSSKQQKNLIQQLEKHIKNANNLESFEFTQVESRNLSANNGPTADLLMKTHTSHDHHKESHKETQSSLQNKTLQSKSSGDHNPNPKPDEDKRGHSKASKKSGGKPGSDATRRQASKSRDWNSKKVIESITKILENINLAATRSPSSKDEASLLEAINSLHVFEFKNACVLGLDLKDCGDLASAADSSLLNSAHFGQLIHNIGILRIKNAGVCAKLLGLLTHPNLIVLTLNRCGLASLTHLSHLDSLKLLNVSDNQLQSLAGLQRSASLAELYANNNRVASLQELKNLRHLKVLSVAHNTISELSEFQYLRRCQSLEFLRVAGNPLCVAKDYASSLSAMLHHLKHIDHFDSEVASAQQVSDFRDFQLLWKDASLVLPHALKTESSARALPPSQDTARAASRSAKRLKSTVKSKREKRVSGLPEESLESYGFSKQKDSVKKVSLSKLLLNRQESAPFLLKEKPAQACSKKGLSSARSKKVSDRDKSAPGDKTKRGHSKSVAGRKLVF